MMTIYPLAVQLRFMMPDASLFPSVLLPLDIFLPQDSGCIRP